ncbi:serine hydrolase domain-containing protein [Actinocrispum wychmicini]|uniref:CubicO group peptidase (Beta-lactamase class C family) n=1 Tax=Actinocrispum wychmicini TaxID=1213861 RepID=A0A4R2JU36_9PSEU|nr:serine hydrolase domain-containing protein [Actinocrispum wychmicini]TCO60776.1 CubicO group peptidase (beta-lactamase class C family) [Actinocrispum wychmicini]
MSRSEEIAAWLPGRLAELIAEHRVPGAQAAVLVDGEIVDAAAGVLSTTTGVEVTTDAVFQIGSITKVWTATLVMQLVDEGLVDLDEPVVTYVPDFKVADPKATATVTVRQLLDHTSGIDGDLFNGTGRGDDAVEKYLATITDAEQVHEPGALFSYCNSGYVVLGRLVEVLRGKPFGAVLHERIAEPLGLKHVAVNPDEAIMFRAAVGHIGEETPEPAPFWSLEPSNAPAGAMLSMRARDLLTWAKAHLDDGGPILSAGTAKAMRVPQVDVPYTAGLASQWGLGWELFGFDAGVFGHDGGTIGQVAMLRISGDANVVVVLLTNGLNGGAMHDDIVGRVLRDYAGAELPVEATPPAQPEPLDASRVSGLYRTPMLDFEVTVDDDGRGWVEILPRTELDGIGVPEGKTEVVALRDDVLIGAERQHGRHLAYSLIEHNGARYLFNSRAARRVEGA